MINQTFDIVRQNDPDRFLLSLMVARQYRAALWAVFAFDVEIAKTKYVVTDATIGRIRLQWWRDAIDEIYQDQKPRRHEVVEPLAVAIKQYQLPQNLFNNAIDAREAEFMPDDIVSKQCFENYCLQSGLSIDQLISKIIGGETYQTASQNFSMIRTTMTIPKQLSHGLLLLPKDLLDKHDLSCQKILDYRRYDDLKLLVKEVLDTGFLKQEDKPASKYFRAMAKLTVLYQNHVINNQYDLFTLSFQKPVAFKAARVWWS